MSATPSTKIDARRKNDMPTYEYRCNECGVKFERFHSIKADPIRDCPECGKKGTVTRLISGGAGLIFKGTGFTSPTTAATATNRRRKKTRPRPASRPKSPRRPSRPRRTIRPSRPHPRADGLKNRPEQYGTVVAIGGKRLSIWGEGEIVHIVRMPLQRHDGSACLDIDAVANSDPFSVRRKLDAVKQLFGETFKAPDKLTRSNIP